jgi:hypothetical protein
MSPVNIVFMGLFRFEAGKNAEETAKLIQHPAEMVQSWYETCQKEKRV